MDCCKASASNITLFAESVIKLTDLHIFFISKWWLQCIILLLRRHDAFSSNSSLFLHLRNLNPISKIIAIIVVMALVGVCRSAFVYSFMYINEWQCVGVSVHRWMYGTICVMGLWKIGSVKREQSSVSEVLLTMFWLVKKMASYVYVIQPFGIEFLGASGLKGGIGEFCQQKCFARWEAFHGLKSHSIHRRPPLDLSGDSYIWGKKANSRQM